MIGLLQHLSSVGVFKMPKVTSKSRSKPVDFSGKKKEDSRKEKPLKAESDDLKIPVDTNDLDDLVKFDSMGFKNPYANMYNQVLVKNIKEKEFALRNFQIDELKDEIKQSMELEVVQKPKGKSTRRSGEPRSPYSIRERKKNINYGEIDINMGKQKVKNTTVPLRRLSQRLLDKPVVSLNESSLTNERIWVVFPEFGGDKEVVKKETVVDYPTGIYRFEPHEGLINCASFCRFGGDRLITSSYDGTVRVLNLEKLVFDQLYGSLDDMRNDWMQWHCQLSPNVILASQ
ncbi:hypothetical protein J437_LFUL001701, partial [Ladona fulva]